MLIKILFGLIFLFALVGAFSIGIIMPFLIDGFEVSPETLVMQTGTFVMDQKANTHDFQVREWWNNKTNYFNDCKISGLGSDEGCYMINIYNVMKDFKYSLSGNSATQVYQPIYVLEQREGQCSNFAYTFCRSAYQFDITCKVECGNNHCWNKVIDYSKITCPEGKCEITKKDIKRTYYVDVTKQELYEEFE